MSSLPDEVVREMTETIVREVDPARIILFGSRARGDARTRSDVDLLIVQDHPFASSRSRLEQKGRLWRALAKFDVSKDILLFAPDEIRRWADSKNHVIAHALREGKVIYERS